MSDSSRKTTRMNQLKVDQQETIIRLKQRGWSARRIARELGYNRETVSKYLLTAKPATPSPGNERKEGGAEPPESPLGDPKPATPSAGSGAQIVAASPEESAIKVEETGCAAELDAARANVSLCVRWKVEIEEGLTKGYSAKRIHEDLVRERGFVGSYQSVKRFVRRLEKDALVPFRRMEFAPGEQLQVDFGTGTWIVDEAGKKQRSHVFRAASGEMISRIGCRFENVDLLRVGFLPLPKKKIYLFRFSSLVD